MIWVEEGHDGPTNKTATIQRQPKQIVEYNHRTTIEWSYYIMVERQKWAVAEFRKLTVENFNETSHWKLLISDIQLRHTSPALAATLMCRGTQVGKHCV